MSKPKNVKEKAAHDAGSGTIRRSTILIIGVIALVAIVAIAAVVVLMPQTGSALPGIGGGAVAGNTVTVYYTGTFENGTIFDSNSDRVPLTVTIGAHRVIPGFENALVGMKAGDTKTVKIPVDQAYGAYNTSYIFVLDRTGTLATMNISGGETLTYGDASTGAVSTVKVLNITNDTVTIDANSQYAGLPLTFTLQLVSIEKGTS
jgi:peptidylprolyl isomerase